MYRIAVVEDDAELCGIISDMLTKYGYETITAFHFRNIIEELQKEQPHLILLDINLPYYDGYYIARELRLAGKVPIIMISARGTEPEQLRGFDLGADDYITKPFSMEMLKAKIDACLRRSYGSGLQRTDSITIGDFSIDQKSFLMCHAGKSTELTKNEFKIIFALAGQEGRIVKRERLLSELWDSMTFVEDNTLNVNISRIKSKLQMIGLSDVIHTKRGEGYMLSLSSCSNSKLAGEQRQNGAAHEAV